MSKGRFARCDGCNEEKMLYPENNYECTSCHAVKDIPAPGLHSLLKSGGWFDDLGPTVISGRTATGRTNMAFVLGDLWEHEGGSVASNIPSCQDATFAGTATEFREWAARTSGPKLFIFDEGMMLLPVENDARMRLMLHNLSKFDVKPVFVLNTFPDWAESTATRLTMKDKTTVEVGDGSVRKGIGGIPLSSFSYDQRDIPEWDWS